MILITFLCLLITFSVFTSSQKLTVEEVEEERSDFIKNNEKLYDYLFQDYLPQIPPVYTQRNINGTVDDNEYLEIPRDSFEILLLNAKLVEVNPMRQLMTIIFHYSMGWLDTRLQWDPHDYFNITQLYIPRKRIWVPDITPFDSTDVLDPRTRLNQWAKVYYNGYIIFPQSTVTSVNCPMEDVVNFPFDVHSCSVRLLSYTFPIQEVNITGYIHPTSNTVGRVGNEEWDVVNISSKAGNIFSDEAQTQQSEFVFTVRRNPGFYLLSVILPSFLITFICIAGFFSSNLIFDDSAKVELGLTTIMSKTALIAIISDIVPKTDNIPKLTNYVLMNLIIILVATGVIICIPKLWQFVSLTSSSCKHRKKGWFRRNFWVFRGIFTAVCFVGFEVCVILNLNEFLEKQLVNVMVNGWGVFEMLDVV